MTTPTFEAMGLSPELHQALAAMNFETPSPIQAEAIPLLLEKNDMIGQAQTGTGKTAAFAIPIIENIDPESNHLQAVVMCPTRELAIQVADEFRKLTKYKPGMSTVCIYGGQPMERQEMALQSEPQVIVATPGRLLDFLWQGRFDLNTVSTVVLDEADRMLDMGFRDDIQRIFDFVPEPRQVVLFSATMPKEILELTKKYQTDPKRVTITPEPQEQALIDQYYLEVSSRNKLDVLKKLLKKHDVKLGLVFCNSKRLVDELSAQLRAAGFKAEGFHSGVLQHKRERIMDKFRRGSVEILVATDVVGRGIDVQNVEAVFNFDLPDDVENYVHRIGRTGRAGKAGLAFSLVSRSQQQKLQAIQRQLKSPPQPLNDPDFPPPAAHRSPGTHQGQPATGAGDASGTPKKRRRRRRPGGPKPDIQAQAAQ